MPHLVLQLSAGLAQRPDLNALCDALNGAMVETGIFPLSGVRVRAFVADAQSIADRHPRNDFLAAQLYIGAGRSLADQQRAGATLHQLLVDWFRAELEAGFFLLSLDLFENNPALSWKTNGLRARLEGA